MHGTVCVLVQLNTRTLWEGTRIFTAAAARVFCVTCLVPIAILFDFSF